MPPCADTFPSVFAETLSLVETAGLYFIIARLGRAMTKKSVLKDYTKYTISSMAVF